MIDRFWSYHLEAKSRSLSSAFLQRATVDMCISRTEDICQNMDTYVEPKFGGLTLKEKAFMLSEGMSEKHTQCLDREFCS
jgi:hypothetical protein